MKISCCTPQVAFGSQASIPGRFSFLQTPPPLLVSLLSQKVRGTVLHSAWFSAKQTPIKRKYFSLSILVNHKWRKRRLSQKSFAHSHRTLCFVLGFFVLLNFWTRLVASLKKNIFIQNHTNQQLDENGFKWLYVYGTTRQCYVIWWISGWMSRSLKKVIITLDFQFLHIITNSDTNTVLHTGLWNVVKFSAVRPSRNIPF